MNSQWIKDFTALVEDIPSDCDYKESSSFLRRLIKSNMLKYNDIHENPEKFFLAHRLILAPGTRGAGFGIRFTVQFNLFAGSIIGLGTSEQVAKLDEFQNKGLLGCFSLTEVFAGVNSGLVVQTKATWIPEKQHFCLDNSFSKSAQKNWISQGFVGEKAVVVATLYMPVAGKKRPKNYGPHVFLIDQRDENTGDLLPGISVEDMGKKTTANDLDNARIKYDNVMLPKDSMLARFCKIENDKYVQTTGERMRLEVIGQRLLTGRLAISQASLAFGRNLYATTKSYTDNKKVFSPSGTPSLSMQPQLASLYQEADELFARCELFTERVEQQLCKVLKESGIPSPELVEKIACAKISCIKTSIDLCHRLKQEVGSYGLMYGTGFEHSDFLQCCAFAEGDTRILQSKLARDALKRFKKADWSEIGKSLVLKGSTSREQTMLTLQLANEMSQAKSPDSAVIIWNENYEKVYKLSSLICQSYFEQEIGLPPALSSKL